MAVGDSGSSRTDEFQPSVCQSSLHLEKDDDIGLTQTSWHFKVRKAPGMASWAVFPGCSDTCV